MEEQMKTNKKLALQLVEQLIEQETLDGDEFTGDYSMYLKCTDISEENAVFLVVETIPTSANKIIIEYFPII